MFQLKLFLQYFNQIIQLRNLQKYASQNPVNLVQSIKASSIIHFLEKEKSQLQLLQDQLQNKDNLGNLVKDILQKNKSKPHLLPPKLPSDNNKLTVVLQMDQFLIYSFTPDQQGYLLAPLRPYDFYQQLDEYNALLSIYKRKNLTNFLNYVKQQCQPVLWTTAVPEYTQLILNLIDPQRKIKHVFTQEHCDRIVVEKEEIDEYVKDLNLLGRDLSKVVYLDSRPLSFWLHPDNAFPQVAFRADNTMDKQDLDLCLLDLEDLRKHNDVRKYLRKKFEIQANLKQCKLL